MRYPESPAIHRTDGRAASIISLIGAVVLTSACGADPSSSQPNGESSSALRTTSVPRDVAGKGTEKVSICHRTGGRRPFIPITIAESALEAHLAHGDSVVDGPVPGQNGMEFDSACTPIPSHGLEESIVVCPSCSPDLLAAKTNGILEAMGLLVQFCGADALPEVCPVTFHLSGDTLCGSYVPGFTGLFFLDASGLGTVCLWDVEKLNRSFPFDVEHAGLIQDQLLPVHEVMHAWFVGRQATYRIEEPFSKYASFVISEQPGGPNYCSFFALTPDDQPDALMKYLCALGMNTDLVSTTLHQTAAAAESKGASLSDTEFAAIVSNVLGQDATPAFQAAGILL